MIAPFRYWNFDNVESGTDQQSGAKINFRTYTCDFEKISGKVGNGAFFSRPSCIAVTQLLNKNINKEFSIEFLFKGSEVNYTTFSTAEMSIRFTYPRIIFRTTVNRSGKKEQDNLIVDLAGSGRRSYNYYTDGKWHHIVFTASTNSGVKQVWVDGVLEQGFEKKIAPGGHFVFAVNDGFRGNVMIDELALYKRVLTPGLIRQHYRQVSSGNHYSFTEDAALARPMKRVDPKKPSGKLTGEIDPLEFAPGYPGYDVQLYDQLRQFPLPRYKQGVEMKRLVSWMDIGYLHRELPNAGGKGFGKTNPQRAVQLVREMAANWNYYVEVPTLRVPGSVSNKSYADKNSLHGALVNFVNSNLQYPWSTILIQLQGRPVHAGFDRRFSYVAAQDLPARYYLRDLSGQPVIINRRKWLSPLMPLDIIKKDGKTSLYYLEQLMKHINRPPELINENGEYFGHTRPLKILEKDPKVLAHFRKSGLSEASYSGWFQYRLDSTYRSEVMQGFDPEKTQFSFYNISATQPAYWPEYAKRRILNTWNGGRVYSTPDFYPRFPNNWRTNQGAYNGYAAIAFGRVTEIALGDKLFSPFISAGWSAEERNVRPAQWLALLKSMVMLGADFFYVGYFNITGAGGKWPDGAGPYDPRGYAYQVVMPAYAQATGSFVREFITEGELLNPAKPADPVYQYRFKGNAENELILVRKLGEKYLIYGSIQPNSNVKGNVPDKTITQISLEGKEIRFPIRRQGSMYILDPSGNKPVFYQVDAWHESTHPWYWSKETEKEAELPDNQSFSENVRSEKQSPGEWNFSNSIAYFNFDGNNNLPGYVFRTRKASPQYCFIRARVRNGKQAALQVRLEGKESGTGHITVTGSDWNWYLVKTLNQDRPIKIFCSEDNPVTILLQSKVRHGKVELDVDKLALRNDNQPPTD